QFTISCDLFYKKFKLLYTNANSIHRKRHSMSKEKSIVLIGFMGVGKSTIGKELANRFRKNYIDVDLEIEKMYGMETTEIFKTHGEKAFREKEKELSIYYVQQSGFIISLGGGAFMNEEIRTICLSRS